MTLFAETRGRQFELFRHFLRRMLDGEWSTAPGQWTSGAIGLISMLLPAGLLLVREGSLDPQYAFRYRQLAASGAAAVHAGAVADQLALIVLLMCVTGGIALLQWQSLFPSRRDYLALAGLPVKSRHIFVARAAAVLLFFVTLVVALCTLPSLIAPFEFGGQRTLNETNRNLIGAQFLTLSAACLFTFFAIMALQGVLLNLAPRGRFERFSSYAQGGLIGLFLFCGLYSWSIKDWAPETVNRLSGSGGWLPPLWFLGLNEFLTGTASPFEGVMAERALLAFACTALTRLALISAPITDIGRFWWKFRSAIPRVAHPVCR